MFGHDRDEIVQPTSLHLEASSACQLRCPSCPTTTGAARPTLSRGFLRAADFRALLDANSRILSVELSNYGEMFLNPELREILRIAFERGVTLSAANGVNFNRVSDEVLEDLVRYRFRSITCSIDGASPETYARYRVGGEFQNVIANIRRLVAIKRSRGAKLPHLSWQFIAFGHNEHEIDKARAMATDLGMAFRVKLSWDEDFSPANDLDLVRGEAGAASRTEYRQRFRSLYVQDLCHQLWDAPQINWDGKVLGCCRNFWAEFGGNAFLDGLSAALNLERIRYARRMLTGRAPERADMPCLRCDIYRTMKDTGLWIERPARLKTIARSAGTRLVPLLRWLRARLRTSLVAQPRPAQGTLERAVRARSRS